ncbi:MAG: TolC family protein [Myxococcaceae bacterium]
MFQRTNSTTFASMRYASVALRDFGEEENALNSEQILREREPILQRAVEDHALALKAIEVEYKVGKVDLITVLEQQLRLASARSTYLRLRSERLVQRVNLYLALGGSFESGADNGQ